MVARKAKRNFKARELYAVFKSSFAKSNNLTELVSGLTWEELSDEGRKAWIAVARKANGTAGKDS